jgi:hypothetical protein
VLFHWQQSQSFKPKRERKKGPPRFCLSYILLGSSFTLCLVSKPSTPKREETERKKKSRLNREMQVAIKKLFVDLLNILVCSATQKHSSNNKPNRSVNSTLLTSLYPICMHTCQILTRCQKKNV